MSVQCGYFWLVCVGGPAPRTTKVMRRVDLLVACVTRQRLD